MYSTRSLQGLLHHNHIIQYTPSQYLFYMPINHGWNKNCCHEDTDIGYIKKKPCSQLPFFVSGLLISRGFSFTRQTLPPSSYRVCILITQKNLQYFPAFSSSLAATCKTYYFGDYQNDNGSIKVTCRACDFLFIANKSHIYPFYPPWANSQCHSHIIHNYITCIHRYECVNTSIPPLHLKTIIIITITSPTRAT